MSTLAAPMPEPESVRPTPLSRRQRNGVVFGVFAVLFGLVFQYRILSLLNKLGIVNVTPLGTKFPLSLDLQHAPQWALPFLYTVDYVNAVWSATLLGLFIGGAVQAFLPELIRRHLGGNGFRQQFAGLIMGLPSMFCSCCAVGATAGLRASGAGRGAAMAYFVTAPALNTVTLILAFELLPVKLAVARLVLGVAAALGATYLASRLIPGKQEEEVCPVGPPPDTSVGEMLARWLAQTAAIARMVLPMLLLGFLLIGLLKTALPVEAVARSFGNGLLPTAAASLLGTLLMVPTFTEVLWVSEFTRAGMGEGPAVALLVVLPSVSFPSLWMLGKVLGSYRAAACLGLFVLVLGLAGGLLFSQF